MGLFGKGVTWSASRSMGDFRGESQPLLSNNQERSQRVRTVTRYLNPIVLIQLVQQVTRWQETKKKSR
uniref:S2 n=1 Tax=Equine infectious anemia virus TaxID=11665 RepID=A0A411K831_9RETR|nr:S2 [Equine infectious anemia virus]